MSQVLVAPQGPITIRPAGADDAAALRALRLEALAGHPIAFAADYDRTEAEPVESWLERLRANEAGDEGAICVAEAGGQLAGMTGLARGHWPKTRHSAVIWGVYVGAGWRGLGVGQALLHECLAWGRAHGVTVAKLGVTTGNAPAIRCYARCGFTVYGLEPQAIYYDGVLYDELLMARTL